jgi:site-specific DNA recombinase
METKIVKVVGYVRVSTTIQVVEGESLATQKQQITDFVKSKEKEGWRLAKIYTDEGLSGSKMESRPQFQQMVSDADNGEFNVIVFTKLSRLARNARQFLDIAHKLKQNKVNLIGIKDTIDFSTQTGKMIAGILSLFAEWEHETIREQMFENKMIKWRDNRSFLGKPPFGYRWNKELHKLEREPKDAEIYQRIVIMYMEQGMAFRDIAIKLNSEGLKCKRTVWSSGTISYVLKNPCYYGYYTCNTVVYVDGKKGAGTKRTKTLKPESEVITFPIPALINKAEWNRLQEKVKSKKIQSKRIGEHTLKYFLRNVLICNRCGGRMTYKVGTQRKDGHINRYYICYWSGTSKKNREGHRDHKCTLPHIKAEIIEHAVWADILVMFALNPKKAFRDIFNPTKYQEKIDDLVQTLVRLDSEIGDKKRSRERLYKLLDMPKCDVAEVNMKLQTNKEEVSSIEANHEKVKKDLELKRKMQTKEQEALKFFTDNKKQFSLLRNEIRNLNLEDRRLLVEAMLDEPIRLDYHELDENYPEDGQGPNAQYHLHFNQEILNRFIDEGKIKRLNQASTDYLAIINNIS